MEAPVSKFEAALEVIAAMFACPDAPVFSLVVLPANSENEALFAIIRRSGDIN